MTFTVIVSSNERPEIKEAIRKVADTIEQQQDFDFLLYTKQGRIPRERKVFPEDFIASVGDGRFAKECAAMREVSKFSGVIAEGKPRYSQQGKLWVNHIESRWTRPAIRNLIRSLRYVEGCDVEWSEDVDETAQLLVETQKYFDAEYHYSLRTRSGIVSSWLTPTYEERLIRFYSGLPGISTTIATKMVPYFPTSMKLHSATFEQLLEVSPIGKKRAERIIVFIHEGRLV